MGTWKDSFKRQVGTGRFWVKLLRDEFNNRDFLDRSDAVHICKKAQSDAYENVINELKGKIEDKELNKIHKMVDELWETDDSSLGMGFGK